MELLRSRILAVGLVAAVLCGVVAEVTLRPTAPPKSAVLVCDFDDLAGMDGRWDLGGLGHDIGNDIVRRVLSPPHCRFEVWRPEGGSNRVHGGSPSRGFTFIVTGSYRLIAPQVVEVCGKIIDADGNTRASFDRYLDRDPVDWITDRISWEVSRTLAALPPVRKPPSRASVQASQAYGRAMEAIDAGGDPVEIAGELKRAAALWPGSAEPLRRLATTEWRSKRFDDTFSALHNALSRTPDRETILLGHFIASECVRYGWTNPQITEAVERSCQWYPGEGSSWVLYQALSARVGLRAVTEYLETAGLLYLAAHEGPAAGENLVDLGRAYNALGGNGAQANADAAAAAAPSAWPGVGRFSDILAIRHDGHLNDSSLRHLVWRGDCPSAKLAVALSLASEKKQDEANLFARQALADSRNLNIPAVARPAVNGFLGQIRAALNTGRLESLRRTPVRAGSPSVDPLTTSLDCLEDQMLCVRYDWRTKRAPRPAAPRLPDDKYVERVETLARAILRIDPLSRFAAGQLVSLDTEGLRPNLRRAITTLGSIEAASGSDYQFVADEAQAHLDLWDAAGDATEVAKAVSLFRQAVRTAPDTSEIMKRAAWELAQRGESLEFAGEYADRLLLATRGSPETERLKGWIDLQKGDYISARKHLALALDTSSASSAIYGDLLARQVDLSLREGKWKEASWWRGNQPWGANDTTGTCYLSGWSVDGSPSNRSPRIAAGAHTVVGYGPPESDGREAVRWVFSTPSLIWRVLMTDVDGDGRREIVIGTGSESSVHGMLYVLDSDGHEKWRYKLGANPPNWHDDKMWIWYLGTADVDGDGTRELVTGASHRPYFASRISVFGPTGTLRYDFWHPGIVGAIVVTRLGRNDSILFQGANNAKLREGGWPAYAGRLDYLRHRATRITGQGPEGEARGIPRGRAPGLAEYVPVKLSENENNWPSYVTGGCLSRVPESQRFGALDAEPRVLRSAILIGVDAPPGLKPLKYASRDASRVKAALQVAGYEAGRIRVLTNSEATKRNLSRVIGKWAHGGRFIPNIVLVHFSGHGFVKGGDVYLAMSGRDRPGDSGAIISLQDLLDVFGPDFRGSTIALCIDCCLSPMDNIRAKRSLAAIAASAKGHQLVIFSACRPGRETREYAALQGGLFTHFLVEGLEASVTKPTDSNNLTLANLAQVVGDNMRSWCEQNGADNEKPALQPPNCGLVVAIRRTAISDKASR